jgi:hypothetical protein
MSRLSVAGTDETENTVKVESEHTKNHTRMYVYTCISYILRVEI